MEDALWEALMERYKALCDRVDELRELGRQEEADKLVEGEMKMVLDILKAEPKST